MDYLQIKLTGTEKQIKFAEGIRKNFSSTLNYLIKHCDLIMSKDPADKQNIITQITTIRNALENILAIEDSKWWIENGKTGHDFECKNKALHQLSEAEVIADPIQKLIKVGIILKQHNLL